MAARPEAPNLHVPNNALLCMCIVSEKRHNTYLQSSPEITLDATRRNNFFYPLTLNLSFHVPDNGGEKPSRDLSLPGVYCFHCARAV